MESFSQILDSYRQQIDREINLYADQIRRSTKERFGTDARLVIDAFFDLLTRGGKRMRGSLAITGYQMCGGTDVQMITRAAMAIEMVQSALLVMDDIQDRSEMRRGKPTVHKLLEAECQKMGLGGDAAHTGISLALNAMLAGQHSALMVVDGLNVDAERRAKAMSIISQTFVVTVHGQTADILNECRDNVDEAAIDRVMDWKTAYYSVLNPLCVGMVLAGAGCEDTDAIRDYAIHTGKAFQITDDIVGIFGDQAKTGKNPMDDVREGKKTLLAVYALAHATADDAAFLRQQLGNPRLTKAHFLRCRTILESSGAREYAEKRAGECVQAAVGALQNAPADWKKDKIAFLCSLVEHMKSRYA
ncbi:MAG TPA: polyprenyl synthetase family protein [Candidatus Saccharimonadales bacterium]